MTFNFDGGDILVIFLVAIILILFRRFDRTGRTLEKVRRYAEKSKSELDSIVKERELGLKDLSVDLEVQEKTNREILARAEIVREEIISRTEEIENKVEHIKENEKALEGLNSLSLRVDENLLRLREESSYVDDVGIRLNEIKEELSMFRQSCTERFETSIAEAMNEFRGELIQLKSELHESERQLTLFGETLENLDAGKQSEIEARFSGFKDDLERIEGDFHTRIQKAVTAGVRLEDAAFTALNEKIESHSKQLEQNWIDEIEVLRERVSITTTEIRESLGDAQQSLESWELDSVSRLETARKEYLAVEKNLKENSIKLESSLVDLNSRITSIAESKETDFLESVEKRQNEYRQIVEERFNRIEGFIKDMDSLAESLSASQEQNIKDVENMYSAFDAEMRKRRDDEKSRIEGQEANLRLDMSELEHGLEELKARAYDNVSEKLQVFEDEFSADLKSRDDQIRTTLDEWRKSADFELAEIGTKAIRNREETEQRYSSELKRKLVELQGRIFSQFEAFQDQVNEFKESINGRILGSENDVASYRDELSVKIANERERSGREFEIVYENFNNETLEKFAKANKTINQKLSDFSDTIETNHKKILTDYQLTIKEASEWKEGMNIQFQEAQKGADDRIISLKSDIETMIAELKDEYADRTERLILESGEERTTLKRDIATIEGSIKRLSTELAERTKDSLDTLKEQSENFLLDFRKSAREARDGIEKKIKELRQSVQESKEKAEINRKEMNAHTSSEYARLMRSLDDIDKRQREFIAETRVFERADEMKRMLEVDIEELNRQIRAVGSGRDEVRRINEQYERAISLYGEVSNKLSRYFSEQQKVENLEGRIARVGSLSESVEIKLERISDVNDSLQGLQVRQNQLEDLNSELVNRYDKLSEKSEILDATTDEVDKNYERMIEIKNLLKELSGKVTPLRDELEAIEERHAQLGEDSAKFDFLAGKVGAIDSTIVELDKKMEELGKAREWLAKMETRLEELSRDTQQRIKLFGTLSKRAVGGKKSSSSPDMSTREMVVRLAREGWNSEEIATNLRLSRGEVELILELQPRN
ncbi:hypothetical protein S1OALGB6SA_1029 [Olavius algarvensis spirochete endosymbiont]|uniref:SpiroCoCo family coiled-coil protein n=1 Tax=Olavius algarvensis spirochete endosymbiont TaxID=260710 RepID=UPI000F107729|nr:hypothetical protein [Olavius algarvensis spirochete endosymbiont]VDA99955.1 hypothetical protein S1OALGB6SA_1029 [Olavius algarvensis spirochete endosymbiont]